MMTTPPTTDDVGRPRGLVSETKLSGRMMTVWRKGKATANRLLGNTPPDVCTTVHEPTHSSLPSFPYDIVEIIIAHLTRHCDTLKACSLTCRSWYTIATPHLHHTLTLTGGGPHSQLEPLSKLCGLGLTHLVREVRVKSRRRGADSWFIPQTINLGLHQFSSLTNVHTLKLENVEIFRFMPSVANFFGHFSRTVRSITLSDPCCSPEQLSHFLSLFSLLDDIEIRNTYITPNIPGTELVPFFAPRLRGRLTLYNSSWVETWRNLISSSGLRFRYVDLRRVPSCAPILLEACAETLETLRLDARDDLVRDLDLSQLKVLRSLQFKAWLASSSRAGHPPAAIMNLFSSITSPVFSELAIILKSYAVNLPQEAELFETLRKMNEIRPFDLVFLLETSDFHRDGVRQQLAGALDSISADGSLDFLRSPPSVHVARPHNYLWDLPHIN